MNDWPSGGRDVTQPPTVLRKGSPESQGRKTGCWGWAVRGSEDRGHRAEQGGHRERGQVWAEDGALGLRT